MREKETQLTATNIDATTLTVTTSLIISSSKPTAARRLSEELASDSDIDDVVNQNENVTDRRISSSMELQTHKSLAPLLPAEGNHVDETPPASIFVIEADVVNYGDHLHLSLEESRDEIDV